MKIRRNHHRQTHHQQQKERKKKRKKKKAFLRVDKVAETKLDSKLVKTTEHCRTVHVKFLIVLDFLVTTTSTETLASKETLYL